jgi:hypothetical protein
MIDRFKDIDKYGYDGILRQLNLIIKELVFYHKLFFISFASIIILSSLGIKKLYCVRKNIHIRFVLFNILANIFFFIIVFYMQMESRGVYHPQTRFFVYIFYWVYILISMSIQPLLEKPLFKQILIFLLLIIVLSHLINYNIYKVIAQKESTDSKIFDYIYSNYNDSSIIFVYDERLYRPRWSTLKKFSFNNPFLLKAKYIKGDIYKSIYKNLDDEFQTIFYNNVFEYNQYIIITNRDIFGKVDKKAFSANIIDSINKSGYNLIFVPLCCNMGNISKLAKGMNKVQIMNTTIFVSQ